MQKGMTIAVSAALLSMATLSAAEAGGRAWNRGGSYTGPHGTTSWQRSGACEGGTCARSRTVTGPHGGSVTREGTVSRDGTWARDVTVTGRNGRTWEKQGHGACADGLCSYGGTVTGPRGNTRSYDGTFGY